MVQNRSKQVWLFGERIPPRNIRKLEVSYRQLGSNVIDHFQILHKPNSEICCLMQLCQLDSPEAVTTTRLNKTYAANISCQENNWTNKQITVIKNVQGIGNVPSWEFSSCQLNSPLLRKILNDAFAQWFCFCFRVRMIKFTSIGELMLFCQIYMEEGADCFVRIFF